MIEKRISLLLLFVRGIAKRRNSLPFLHVIERRKAKSTATGGASPYGGSRRHLHSNAGGGVFFTFQPSDMMANMY